LIRKGEDEPIPVVDAGIIQALNVRQGMGVHFALQASRARW
jgi:hypothetical protein